MTSRKHWLAFTTRTRGKLVIDDGAVRAVVRGGRSLLPAGVVAVKGEFGIGDAVTCVDSAGHELARGLVVATVDLDGNGTREVWLRTDAGSSTDHTLETWNGNEVRVVGDWGCE